MIFEGIRFRYTGSGCMCWLLFEYESNQYAHMSMSLCCYDWICDGTRDNLQCQSDAAQSQALPHPRCRSIKVGWVKRLKTCRTGTTLWSLSPATHSCQLQAFIPACTRKHFDVLTCLPKPTPDMSDITTTSTRRYMHELQSLAPGFTASACRLWTS